MLSVRLPYLSTCLSRFPWMLDLVSTWRRRRLILDWSLEPLRPVPSLFSGASRRRRLFKVSRTLALSSMPGSCGHAMSLEFLLRDCYSQQASSICTAVRYLSISRLVRVVAETCPCAIWLRRLHLWSSAAGSLPSADLPLERYLSPPHCHAGLSQPFFEKKNLS